MHTVHLLRKYNPAEWGGTETAIHRLFDGLRKQDVSSVVYCPKLDCACSVNDPLQAAGCRIERFKAFVPVWGISTAEKRQLVSVGGNLMSFDLISALWRQKNVSLVHTHALGRIGAIGATFARRRKIPLVASIHGGVLDLPANLKSSFHNPIRKGVEWGRIFGMLLRSPQLLDDADAIVTCNPREAALHQEKYPRKHVMVQPHGVPMDLYRRDQRTAAQVAFPHLTNRRILLAVGRIDSIKNQAWLIEQLPALLEKHPEAVLVLAGACTEEKYGKRIEKRIQELGLGERVFLTGGLPPGDPRLIGLLQVAEALLLPSVSETFGLVLLEAWAAGTSVISSRTSGASTLIKQGENGLLFDLDNPQSFHEAVDHTLLNRELRREMIASGARLVAAEYNTDVLAGRMKRLYETLIQEKNALRHSS
ncbi:glycosyltransferase family 4 protein [Pedosphaera parvula]|uniref:Glycosyl transferase group 1 n=1 Tax=Pedosphaera parvula (strain Ellin514) TaxID=320771 RepID=B9X9S9_PEDPL|nr:glycosyltransferase [Pedosphaera parvula]EEF63230.1 glycosyl transferase group 1 [Pedosphaera parvula Ellin514]